jgi:flagellar biosynthesis/type III secretory pathway protein FliH
MSPRPHTLSHPNTFAPLATTLYKLSHELAAQLLTFRPTHRPLSKATISSADLQTYLIGVANLKDPLKAYDDAKNALTKEVQQVVSARQLDLYFTPPRDAAPTQPGTIQAVAQVLRAKAVDVSKGLNGLEQVVSEFQHEGCLEGVEDGDLEAYVKMEGEVTVVLEEFRNVLGDMKGVVDGELEKMEEKGERVGSEEEESE